MKVYKTTHKSWVMNLKGKWLHIIKQQQVIETDKYGNISLMISIVDVDASHDLYNSHKNINHFSVIPHLPGKQMNSSIILNLISTTYQSLF